MHNASLQAMWQQHDWQRSPFAPDLRIVQALVQGGKTASGAGFSRYNALMRCLGETAEIAALKAGETSEGLAAGPDPAFAGYQALAERLERWAVWRWWHGQLAAAPLPAPPELAKLRKNAPRPRQTAFWALPDFQLLNVVIAKSTDTTGGAPILGFGAGPSMGIAAHAATIELGLMELNLLSPSDHLAAYFSRILAAGEPKFPAIPPASLPPPAPQPANKLSTLKAALAKAGVGFSLQPCPLPDTDLSVIRAVIPQAPRWDSAPRDTPLL